MGIENIKTITTVPAQDVNNISQIVKGIYDSSNSARIWPSAYIRSSSSGNLRKVGPYRPQPVDDVTTFRDYYFYLWRHANFPGYSELIGTNSNPVGDIVFQKRPGTNNFVFAMHYNWNLPTNAYMKLVMVPTAAQSLPNFSMSNSVLSYIKDGFYYTLPINRDSTFATTLGRSWYPQWNQKQEANVLSNGGLGDETGYIPALMTTINDDSLAYGFAADFILQQV